MQTDAVLGCDAVNAGPEWLRLKTAGGATRTLPWSAVSFAGMIAKGEAQITIEGMTEKTAPLLGTHDSLWVVYAEGGLAQVMIEKISPKRDPLLAAFEQHLGDRWQGGDLQESELIGAMMIPAKIRIKKMLILPLIMMGVIFFAILAMIFFTHGAKPTAP
jgi:hypothetical protein